MAVNHLNQGDPAVCDNAKVFRAVRDKLAKLHPDQPRGNFARHLDTLAGLVSGIVGSKSVNLPKVASKVPDGNKPSSREKKFSRLIDNQHVDFENYFLPYVETMLSRLVGEILVIAIDGSTVGRGCMTLMASVIFQGRSLPVAWLVVKGKKGHLAESFHLELLNSLKDIVPDGKHVVILGDGEFDGIRLQENIKSYGWDYACRTGVNISILWNGHEIKCGDALESLEPGKYIMFKDILFTEEKYGPVNVVCYWRRGYKEPIFLVTNIDSPGKACALYRLRFRIETLFSDKKSRGFNIHKSHLSDPERITRLLIAVSLAYIWIVFLGVVAKTEGWVGIIHRTKRCDLSLFQLGLRFLEHLINEGMKVIVLFSF